LLLGRLTGASRDASSGDDSGVARLVSTPRWRHARNRLGDVPFVRNRLPARVTALPRIGMQPETVCCCAPEPWRRIRIWKVTPRAAAERGRLGVDSHGRATWLDGAPMTGGGTARQRGAKNRIVRSRLSVGIDLVRR
jgi:hypothetical protein